MIKVHVMCEISLCMKWLLTILFWQIQFLQGTQFTNQCLILTLQNSNTVFQTSHILFFLPSTLFGSFPNNVQDICKNQRLELAIPIFTKPDISFPLRLFS